VTGYDEAGDAWADEPALTMSVTHCNDAVVVQARGEIDLATRAVFEHRIRAACGVAPQVWLDLAEVTFLDPQGARLLASLQGAHARLRIASASPAVRRSVEIVGLIDGVAAAPVLDAGGEPGRGVASH
jgi:anti-anti-sigma factor